MEFLKNDCFSVDGRRYRFLNAFAQPPRVYVIDIDEPKAVPKRWSREYLHELSRPPVRLKRLETILPCRPHTERERDSARGMKRYTHVKALVESEAIYEKASRGLLLREYSKRTNVSTDALLAWLRMWWQRGQMLDALISDFHRSGRITEMTNGALSVTVKGEGGEVLKFIAPVRGKPRGAPPKPKEGNGLTKAQAATGVNAAYGTDKLPPAYIPYQISDAEHLQILGMAWSHYGENSHKTMRGATTKVLAELYTERDEKGVPKLNEHGDYIVRPLGQRPTYRQIQTRLNQAKSLSVQHRARYSPADYANNIKPRFGSIKQDCLGPGDVGELDATTLDGSLVDRELRKYILGRPTVYLLTDRWSRLITGFHISLENPSWEEARLVLLNSCSDWGVLAKRLGVRIKPSDLIANGRWYNRLVADRGGDMLYGATDVVCDGMETQVTNTRALHSLQKAIAESEFKGMPMAMRQFMPGYIPPEDNRQRRKKPHSKTARLTLDMMRANLMRIIIARNRAQRYGYEATPKEIALGVSLAPLDIWQRGVEELTSYGMRFPYDYVRQKLMRRARAKVHGDGFFFRCCNYNVPELAEWNVRARLLGNFDVNISYESNWVDTIVIHHPSNSKETYTATLNAKDKKWAGYSFAERESAYSNELRNQRNGKPAEENEGVGVYIDMQWMNQPEIEATERAIKGMTLNEREKSPEQSAALKKERRERRMEAHALCASLPADTSVLCNEGAQAETPSEAPADVPSTARGLPVEGGYVLPVTDDSPDFNVAPGSRDVYRELYESIDADDDNDSDSDDQDTRDGDGDGDYDNGYPLCATSPNKSPRLGGGAAALLNDPHQQQLEAF